MEQNQVISIVLDKQEVVNSSTFKRNKKTKQVRKNFTYIIKSKRAAMVLCNNWLHDRSQFNEAFMATHKHWVEQLVNLRPL